MLGAIWPWSWVVVFTLTYAVFMAPAYAAGWWLKERLHLDEPIAPLAGVAIVSLAGYLTVWAYFANPVLGRVLSCSFLVLAIFAAGTAAWRINWRSASVRTPAILVYVVGALYLSILYSCGDVNAGGRFFMIRPPDNVLPQTFAEHLYLGSGLRDLVAGWHGSDRPPLESGLQLLSRPIARILGLRDVFYECAGTVAQLSWILAFWSLCARMRMTARGRVIALVLAIFSGYFLYNSVYVWPKLLAASLSVAFALFLWDGMERQSRARIVLAAVAGAEAYLAHGGATFFLLPVGLGIVAAKLQRETLPSLALAAALGLVLIAPWSLYQRYYDPPGDRLIKVHIAGIDDPALGALTAIRNQYRTTPFSTIIAYKLSNLRTAVLGSDLESNATAGEALTPINRWRLSEREYVFAALAWTNLGWLFLIWDLSMHRAQVLKHARFAMLLFASAFLSLVFWSLITWGPRETVVTHSAYAVDLVLFAALGFFIAEAPARLAGLAVVAQGGDFFLIWVIGTEHDGASHGSPTSLLSLAMMAASTIAIMVTLYTSLERERSPRRAAVHGRGRRDPAVIR